ncbi:MAG: hypothetical protein BWZ01_03243 [Deltaproteobacteria bacterium ADurb.BinA179]|nr:MAG: hypothetical protein BWZ01_03243 [Deltaproteobacteria bacterium ADurb.BinA179]
MLTKPPVAIVSPSCMARTASSADTTLPLRMREGGREESIG